MACGCKDKNGSGSKISDLTDFRSEKRSTTNQLLIWLSFALALISFLTRKR